MASISSPISFPSSHYTALKSFLESYLTQIDLSNINNQRQAARDKLTRLTESQFQELATDVFDEMNRRVANDPNMPFLIVQETFHQKRNQARQKLATLSQNRFRDLACDVYFELERRYSDAQLSGKGNDVGLLSHNQTRGGDSTQVVTNGDLVNSRVDSIVNFHALDNLMADLGTMISTEPSTATLKDPTKLNRSNSQITPNSTAYQAARKNSVKNDLLAQSGSSSRSRNNSESAVRQQLLERSASPNTSETAAQLKQLEDKIVKYKSENARLETMVVQLQGESESFKSELKKMEHDRDKYRHLLSQLEQDSKDQELALKTRIGLLEDTIKKESSAMYMDRVLELESTCKSLTTENNQLRMENQTLNSDLNEMKHTLMNERRQTHDYSQEVQTLSSQIEQLRSTQQQFDRSKDTYEQTIQQLRGEIDQLNYKVQQAHTDMEKLQRGSIGQQNTAQDQVMTLLNLNADELYSNHGFLSVKDIRDFRRSLLDLINASEGDRRPQVLVSMKSVVLATKDISERVERFESNLNGTVSQSDIERTADHRNSLSKNLTELMHATKNHATETVPAESSRAAIHAACIELSKDIFGLTKLLQISCMGGNPNADPTPPAVPSKPPPNPHVSRTAVISEPVNSHESKGNQMEDIRSFLEQQTDLIVQNIQTLLLEMRQPHFSPTFKQTIDNITGVVRHLLQVCRNMLSQPIISDAQRSRGQEVLHALSESNRRLDDMAQSMLQSKSMEAVKPSKQKLAASAYEVAKCTKELVTLFDVQ